MARRKRGRNISGIVLLDKAQGITSNLALQNVKRLFNAAKAGHTGSLDPMATGVLPLCLGEATKVSGFLLDADKSYHGTIKLGIKTNSADAEGEVIETREVANYSAAELQSALEKFTGEIEQVPPMHSALKVDGQPLYKLAHQGKSIERKSRKVTIHKIDILRYEGDELEIAVDCSKGTYIRTLAEDIAEELGCGGHLSALRRTRSGPFKLENCLSFEQLQAMKNDSSDQDWQQLDAILVPAEDALHDWHSLELTENTAYYLKQGQAVMVPNAPVEGLVKLFAPESGFLGIGEIQDDGKVAPKRLFVFDSDQASQG